MAVMCLPASVLVNFTGKLNRYDVYTKYDYTNRSHPHLHQLLGPPSFFFGELATGERVECEIKGGRGSVAKGSERGRREGKREKGSGKDLLK